MFNIPNSIKLKYLILFIPACLMLLSCTRKQEPASAGSEWISLFDGKTFNGWKAYAADSISAKWEIEDGMIIVSRQGDDVDKNTGFGRSIMTVDTFSNFELELEYRMSPGGNSGIMYHVVEDSAYFNDYETGPEYQLLDDTNSPTESLHKRFTASLYDMLAPKEDKTLHPAGQWNAVKIVYNNGHVQHWLNGEKVLEYLEGSDRWNQAYTRSKWVNFPGWAKYKSGHISLQDHGDYVAFRNIRIRRLSSQNE